MLTRFHSQSLLTIRRVGGGGRESLASPRAETVYLLLTEQLVHVRSEQEGTCELLGHKVGIQFCLRDEKVQFPLLSSCLKRESINTHTLLVAHFTLGWSGFHVL